MRWAQTRINTAAHFLTALHADGRTLAQATQHDVDRWLAGGRSTRYDIRDFLQWAARRGHCADLTVPVRRSPEPEAMDEEAHWEVLHQCLTDTELPLEARAAGAILLLFGLEATRIAALPVSAVSGTGDQAALVLDQIPVRLPASLASLLLELTHRPPPVGWAANRPGRWLFPGTEPGRHLTSTALMRRLVECGIPIRPGRATALVQLAQDVPPAVLAPLLGLHITTVVKWRQRAATDWTAYLQARTTSRSQGSGTSALSPVNAGNGPPTIG
ncbi:hypothetical protein ACFY00_30795 [Kitasatospora sp. NPDC001540]|uniref:hypothetical protein n=1 Tax=Kitasatospora sp. NPDC001540 TaxID=3364014 RepID=UPI0036D117B3